MKHHIIVKFNDKVSDKAALMSEIETLFSRWQEVEGVHGCALIPNCVERPNRYDLMIVLDMDKEALPRWDACEVHHTWKDKFGVYVGSKAIFDCE